MQEIGREVLLDRYLLEVQRCKGRDLDRFWWSIELSKQSTHTYSLEWFKRFCRGYNVCLEPICRLNILVFESHSNRVLDYTSTRASLVLPTVPKIQFGVSKLDSVWFEVVDCD